MSKITTIVSEKLPMQLDSVSWNTKFDLLAVGAYMIDPNDSTRRIGKIFMLNLKLELEDYGEGNRNFELLQEIDLDGVLDLRWEPQEQTKLAVATSTGVELFELSTEKPQGLNSLSRLQLNCMALYCQWMDSEKLVFSDADGVINIVSVNPNHLKLESSKKVHDSLTWVVQYCAENDTIFAGSDDGKFTGFLIENIDDEEKHYKKKFQVGVTSIIFLNSNTIGVGSYDDTLKLFTIDHLNPISLTLKKKIEFGGAVWRTKCLPSVVAPPEEEDNSVMIVAACARNGIHLLHLSTETWTCTKILECLQHEGFLAYGLDAKLDRESKTYVITSCYFDNQQLHVWKSSPTT